MKTLKITLLCLITIGVFIIFAHEMSEIAAAEMSQSGMVIDKVTKGKALFNDPTLGTSTNVNSCNTCHPDGRGLEKAGEKKEFHIMGKKQGSIEEAVNICIEMPLQGKALEPESEDMANIVAYIKSLKKKEE